MREEDFRWDYKTKYNDAMLMLSAIVYSMGGEIKVRDKDIKRALGNGKIMFEQNPNDGFIISNHTGQK